MKSLKVKTTLTERYNDLHEDEFRKMTNRVRTLHETPEGTPCVKLHGKWWEVIRCAGSYQWDRAYLVERLDNDL